MLLKTRAKPSIATSEPQRGMSLSECEARFSDGDAEVRSQAARELAVCDSGARVLLSRLEQEQSTLVRESIFTSLTQLGDSRAVAGMVELLRSEDAELRNGAIEALKLLPESVAEFIPGLLADIDPDVRILTISILESLRHPLVEEWLIEVIEEDQHLNVCGAALDLLAEVGTERSVGPIRGLRERFKDAPYMQFTADLVLKRIEEGNAA
jgi:HEAT repeat protein